ncbi:MAG: hypothetical protein O3A00_14515 [Planctomycetota bacterium]|nr:hypothetical protein [Planctomycetota bacterium]
MIERHPELFPEAIVQNGFSFDGHERESKRIPGVRLRRITPKGGVKKVVYTIRPSEVLPSMVGKTGDVKNALLLLSHGDSADVVAEVCGRNRPTRKPAGRQAGRS